jgi:flagellar biosynthesis/type III secretory pathway chaperone
MPPLLQELLGVLRRLVAEHQALLRELEAQRDAMKRLDLASLDAATRAQEQSRSRIVQLEQRRRAIVEQLARSLKLTAPLSLAKLAQASSEHGAALLALRDELRSLIEQVRVAGQVSTRVAGAVVGHMNTVLRLIGTVAQQAGGYTRSGAPRVASRIGVMEAVG